MLGQRKGEHIWKNWLNGKETDISSFLTLTGRVQEDLKIYTKTWKLREFFFAGLSLSLTQFKTRLHVCYKAGRKDWKFMLEEGEGEGMTKDSIKD